MPLIEQLNSKEVDCGTITPHQCLPKANVYCNKLEKALHDTNNHSAMQTLAFSAPLQHQIHITIP